MVPYSELEQQLKEGKVAALTIREQQICGELTIPDEKGKKLIVANRVDPKLAESLAQYNIPYTQVHESKFFSTLLSWIIPVLIFFGISFFVNLSKSRLQGVDFKLLASPRPKYTWRKKPGSLLMMLQV